MTTESLVPVEVPCLCPDTPHEGDTVYLHPKIGLQGGAVAQRKIIAAIQGGAERDEIMGSLMDVYVRYGVADWTFTNGNSHKLEVTPENVEKRLLSDFTIGYLVADKADDLYSNALLDPLRAGVSKSSRPTPIKGSTSAKTSSSPKRRKP